MSLFVLVLALFLVAPYQCHGRSQHSLQNEQSKQRVLGHLSNMLSANSQRAATQSGADTTSGNELTGSTVAPFIDTYLTFQATKDKRLCAAVEASDPEEMKKWLDAGMLQGLDTNDAL